MDTDFPCVSSRVSSEEGFSFVELLVVILLVAILAATATAAFLSQRGKAYTGSAKQLASEAQTAVEAIATANNGRYGEGSRSFITPSEVHAFEPAIPISASQGGGSGAWLAEARATEEGKGYELTVVSGAQPVERFTVKRLSDGTIVRSCEPKNPAAGCNGSW
jgi:prepilin-type N-terminal cleavage/methylation domain-containing protein